MLKLKKDIFIGFYMIRKLAEAQKITDTAAKLEVEMMSYPRLEKQVDRFNRSSWEELYDLNNGSVVKNNISFVYNQIIHSFIFSQVFEDQKETLHSIFFTSDRQRNKCIYGLDIQELIRLFITVGSDEVKKVTFERDEKTKEMKIREVL